MSIQQSEIWQPHLSWEIRQEPYYLSGQEYGTNRAQCLREYNQHFVLITQGNIDCWIIQHMY